MILYVDASKTKAPPAAGKICGQNQWRKQGNRYHINRQTLPDHSIFFPWTQQWDTGNKSSADFG